jgi:hypothetical protein
MKSDEQAAQKARAESLRKEIAELTSCEAVTDVDPSADSGCDTARASSPKESPRHFVGRRMRELDKGRTN